MKELKLQELKLDYNTSLDIYFFILIRRIILKSMHKSQSNRLQINLLIPSIIGVIFIATIGLFSSPAIAASNGYELNNTSYK